MRIIMCGVEGTKMAADFENIEYASNSVLLFTQCRSVVIELWNGPLLFFTIKPSFPLDMI
jgi:hypothetical protein